MLKIKENFIYVPYILIALIPITLITGPAVPDLSLFVVCLIFIIYLYKYNINLLSNNFSYYSLFFWICLLLLNLVSLNFYKSFGESFIFGRMLLLPIIMYLWLLKTNKLIKNVILIVLFANLIVLFDSIYQFLNYHPLNGFGDDIFSRKAEIYGRLSGPFLDMVPGSYIAKFFIFGFIGITILFDKKIIFLVISIIYLSLCGYLTFISGERMAAATFFLAMILSTTLLKNYRIIFIISSIICLAICYLTINLHDHYNNFKVIDSKPGHLGLTIEKFDPNCNQLSECKKLINVQPNFLEVLKNFDQSAYYETYSLSLEMVKSYPLTGIGMNNFNYGCKFVEEFKRERCWSHPHNFYLQWLTENGLIGFLCFIIYVAFIFYIVISSKNFAYKNYSFIALSVIFWPIMSTGSLLKNWHGIETFFIIGLSLSLLNFNKENN